MALSYSQKFYDYCKNAFHSYFSKFLITLAIWGILAEIFYLILMPRLDNFTPIFGCSFGIVMAMILAGYICFIFYYKIPDFGDLTALITNYQKKWADSSTQDHIKSGDNAQDKDVTTRSESAKFAYEKLLVLRDVDNNLFWTRINMLIVFQGVLLAALVTIFKEISTKFPQFVFLIIVVGFISSIVLYAITKGGSYWVHHWEEKLAIIEPFALGEWKIFSKDHHAQDPTFKKNQKKKGYISTRDWVVAFSILLPLVWILIFVCFWALNSP